MSKVIKAIDAKSFIIGVLSAVVVVMAMGAGAIQKGWDYEQKWQIDAVEWNKSNERVQGMEPFAVTNPTSAGNSKAVVWYRLPRN